MTGSNRWMRKSTATSPDRPASSPLPSTPAVVLAGALTLAVAMGIGRFAFTPLLPLMMQEGLIDAAVGAELAAVNYLGYLVGALTAARLAGRPLHLVQACLLAIVLLTAGAGLASSEAAWVALRFGAGVASAWAMVGISSWSLSTLALRGQGALGALVFGGVGGGIVLAGGLAWLSHTGGARALWLQLAAVAGVLGCVVLGLTWRAPRPVAAAVAGAATAAVGATPVAEPAPGRALPAGSWPLVICYGSFGFGYILPATFLPAMARALVDDPQRFGLAWPLFGLAAWVSTLVAVRGLQQWVPLRAWALCQAAVGLGAALPLISQTGAAIAAAALLVGGTFVVATLIGLQQVRALMPQHPARLVGRMTAAFALGQILGPLAVRALAGVRLGPWGALEISSAAAALLMAGTAAWLWRLGGSSAGPAPQG
jgi:MFS family permease